MMVILPFVLSIACIGLWAPKECGGHPWSSENVHCKRFTLYTHLRDSHRPNGPIHPLNISKVIKTSTKHKSASLTWNRNEVSELLHFLCIFQIKESAEILYPFHHLLNRFRRQVKQETKTVVSGQTAVLMCPSGGRTVESIVWSKDGLTLPVNPRQSIMSNGSLSIQKVTQSSDGGEYNCRYHDDRHRSKNYVVILRVAEPPAVSPFQFPSDVVLGMRVRVMCSVIRGDPPFHFTWLKDGSILSASDGLSVQYFQDYSILSTGNLVSKNSGNYTCSVNNGAGSASHSAHLTVNAPPSWILEPQNSEVILEGSVRIDCSADGLPAPIITWRKATNDEPADYTPVYNNHKHTVYPNGSLFIHSASKDEEGYYLCEARNGYGANLNKLTNLTVHQPPTFDVKFRSHSAQKGQSVDLSCAAVGDQPIKFIWKKDGRMLTNSSRYLLSASELQQSTEVSILKIMKANRNDSGIYLCRSHNEYGQDEMKIKLLIQEVPGPPSNLSVTNVTGRTISLVWTEPYTGNSDISRYFIKYQKELPGHQRSMMINRTIEGSQRTAVLRGLEPASSYLVSIDAQNAVGRGSESDWIRVKTEQEAPSGPPEEIAAQATGPNSIKVTWKPPQEDYWNGKIIGYYIGYKPIDETLHMYKTVHVKDVTAREQYHLTNLKRSTIYHITIHAFNSKGPGPRSDEVQVKTLDDVPPSAPDLKMLSKSTSSITLKWSQRATFGASVVDYKLHYREENDHVGWTVIPISTNQNQYTVQNLKCGTTYQFFMTSHNSVGRSEPSNKLIIRTTGAAPVSPAREDFISINVTEAILDFSKWQDGGCFITSYTVKLRQKFHTRWKTLVDNLIFNKSPFQVTALSSATWYEVLVVVQSSAGATEAMYDFRTRNKTREIVPQETANVPKPPTKSFIIDLEVLVPITVSSFVVVVVIVVGCVLCIREARSHRRINENQVYGKTSQDVIQMKDIGNTPPLDYVSSEDGTQRSSPYSQSTNHCPPRESMLDSRPEEELHPYATPYDTLPVAPSNDNQHQPGTSGIRTLTRRGRDKRTHNVYSRQDESARAAL
ncbi:Down syndrome cell adhesion molecule homolog isoform X2 [Limulus polyphemus]|uniref:Down syndrome cell adhesion molecule homolog isoform X2 n=1 Tax=Limulus polyphemus TaxID=6850 RepID=A0ABM1SV33_LIMPO|nr:Down syndrome cell adhesion molecule homolog isoform X2 [Limulus polyphemus]